MNDKADTNKTTELADLSVKQLREELVKLGMPVEDAEGFDTKKPIISTINTLKAKKAIEEAVETVESMAKLDPVEEKNVNKKWASKKELMRIKLMAQPKVKIRIACEGKEQPGVVRWVMNPKTKVEEQVYISGAYHAVQLNGYKWLIPKGSYEEVPQQVADQILKAQKNTDEAGKEFNLAISRMDPETGRPVSNQL